MTKIDRLNIEIKRVSNGFVVSLQVLNESSYERVNTDTIHSTIEAAFDYIKEQTVVAEEGFKLQLTA